MYKYLFLALFISAFSPTFGQSFNNAQKARLCLQYYRNGEFEKAAACFEELHNKDRSHDYYYERYLSALFELEDYKTAEKVIKRAIKASPEKLERRVDYGRLYARQQEMEKAEKEYKRAIKELTGNQIQISRLANAFQKQDRHAEMVATYEKGEKLLGQPGIFAYQRGNAHRLAGNAEEMVKAYLDAIEAVPGRLTNIQAFLQRYLPEMTGSYEVLKTELFRRSQKDANNSLYPEMLVWVYVQEEDFESALVQARALDLRLQENGSRVYKLAQMALNEEQYQAALDAFAYIVEEKGKSSIYYINAKEQILYTKRKQLSKGFAYTEEQLRTLEGEYKAFLKEFGQNAGTYGIMKQLAELEALYLNDLEQAIQILKAAVEMPRLNRKLLAEAKIQLGDYFLMNQEVWEASLLYSQVDKDQKDSPLGEMARYKNAKLSYYKGDFEWAQDQLEILKGASSELISNDAIDVSVFIMEHYNLDTTANSMRLFAQAELKIFQHRFEEAFSQMDSIKLLYKGHGLEDDIHFAKAKVFLQKLDYSKALTELEQIVANYPEGILVDNALFQMAQIYEERLNEPEKAMPLYEQILMEHMGSYFTVEARKRFRKLRGDGV